MPRAARRLVLSAERLEDRVNPVSFSSTDSYWMGGNVMSVAVGDLNGDGHADVAAGDAENGVEILLNDGTGKFVRGEVLPIGAPFNVKLADLNADGKLDIYVTNAWGSQFCAALGNGDGTFQVVQTKTFTTYTQGAAVADFNGDGKLDAVVADQRGAAVLLYDGSPGLFSAPVFYHPATSQESMGVATGDFNGDGHPDFGLIDYGAQHLDIFLNNGDGTFGAPTPYADVVGGGPRGIIAQDFNNDGKLDLMMGIEYTSYLGLYLGNGDGTFQNPIGVNTSNTWNGPIAAADFDLDGNLDLVVMRAGDGDEIVMLGDGTGHFTFGTTIFYAYPGGVAAGDLNGDGLPDVVTGHALSPGILNISTNTTTNAGPAVSSFDVSAPASTNAGDSFTVTLTARDSNGGTATGYTGTVHVTSSDGGALLPADVVFTPDDQGVKTITVTLYAAGSQSIDIADVNHSSTTGSAQVDVSPAEAATFEFAAPDTVQVGSAFDVTITARDPFGNVATGYSGIVHFTSTDPDAQLPVDTTLTNGVGTVSVTFMTEGEWTLTASDDADNLLTESDPITATPPPPAPAIVADFGANGLQRWTAAGGWVVISPLNAERVVVSGDGQTVVADFGAHGLKRWIAADGWQPLTAANVESEAVSFDGSTVLADFGSGGLKRWTEGNGWTKLSSRNAQNSFLSEDGDAVVADFGLGGLRRWSEGNGWFTATNADPRHVAVDATCETVYADFDSIGLLRWTATDNHWLRMSPANVRRLAVTDDGQTLAADLVGRGLQTWTESGGWVKLSPMTTEHFSISPDGQTVVADFGTRGLRRWTSAGWEVLSSANPQDAILSADGQTVVADFGTHGLQVFGSTWTTLSTLDPDQIMVV